MKRILLVSYFAPGRGHAGGLRLLDLYANIKKINPEIWLALITCSHPDVDWGMEGLDGIFSEIHWLPPEYFTAKTIDFKKIDKNFDIIDLQYHQSGELIGVIRKNFSNSIIIFSPMESQIRALWIILKNIVENSKIMRLASGFYLAAQELLYTIGADRVGCVSIDDLNSFKPFIARRKLFLVETGFSEIELSNHSFFDPNFGAKEKGKIFRLVFLAYFGSQTNRDALKWFCKHVHPLIARQLDNYELLVVGRGLDDALRFECAYESINWVGEVEDIAPVILSSAAGIAPALSGAGVRGKIHQYSALGIPCVASTISAASLKYIHGISIFRADSPLDFSRYCLALLSNEKLAKNMGSQAKKLCLTEYTWDSMEPDIKKLYSLD